MTSQQSKRIWMDMHRPVVTLLTDFGLEDAYVAQIKARILSSIPDVKLVDITHSLPPFGVIPAGWLLSTSYPYFPRGSIHLCVVDPGVGTSRAVLAILKDGHAFVGPDNGVFSFLYPAQSVIEVTWRPSGNISGTFHGRDIFAPVVVELLKYVPPQTLGRPFGKPVIIDVSRDMVVHVDRFGNVVTNIEGSRLKAGCTLTVGEKKISRVAESYAGIPPGELGLIVGSASTVEVAANRVSAASLLGAEAGMPVRFEPRASQE